MKLSSVGMTIRPHRYNLKQNPAYSPLLAMLAKGIVQTGISKGV